MGELICLHVGQAGIQIGNACWELFCLEHDIQPDGYMSPEAFEDGDYSFNTFFSQTGAGKFVPRALYLDGDPLVNDEVRTGPYRQLFRVDQLINGKTDAADIYAKGKTELGKDLLEISLNRIRLLANECERFQGFCAFMSLDGGTGSGLGTALLERLTVDYKNKPKLAFLIYPSKQFTTSVVHNYNAMLSTRQFIKNKCMSLLFDNGALYRICQRCLGLERPTYTNLNRLIAQVVSSVTASLRFEGSLNVDLAEFETNLLPYSNVRFLLPSYAPFLPSGKNTPQNTTVAKITEAAFEPGHLMLDVEPRQGRYMASCLMYRGDVVSKDVTTAMTKLKKDGSLKFVNWCPTGFKCGINSQPPTLVPGGDLGSVPRSLCTVSNTTAIIQAFQQAWVKFEKMYEKRAYVHWFVGAGMEEGEFSEAQEDVKLLMEDYKKIGSDLRPGEGEEESDEEA